MKKIGIVTFHSSHNYGSVFQSYALAHYLQGLGYDAKIIDFRHPAAKGMYEFTWWDKYSSTKGNIKNILTRGILRRGRKRMQVFNQFIEKYHPLTKRYKTRFEIDEHFDYLICGSDQIWNPRAKDSRDMIYFLDFGDQDTIRFSYAASSGSRKFLDEELPVIKPLLQRMKSIGVREQFMQDYLKNELGFESTVNPDPTILLEKEDWEKLEEPVDGLPKKFVVLYTLLDIQNTINRARIIADKLGLPLVLINKRVSPLKREKLDVDYNLYNLSPGQFLWLFHHAEFAISNSFHGNMFSIIYRKNFGYPANDFHDTRIVTIHEKIGLGKSRFLQDVNDFDASQATINYGLLESRIDSFRNEGINYLTKCLKDE